MNASLATKIQRLSDVSARRVVDPDVEVQGEPGPGQVIPDDLLSIHGLDLDLTPEQRARLSREEVAAITKVGIRFEAVLEAGFAMEVATRLEPTDPRTIFLLHEIGEETRHQRLFIRLVESLQPTAISPAEKRLPKLILRTILRRLIHMPALLYTMVLAGEEIPDLIQKQASEHPETDPFLREVNRYHRMEEARHLSFARSVLPEVWAEAGPFDRWAVRHVAPRFIAFTFSMLVHPGVYEAVGLDGWSTWKAVNSSPQRLALRHEATRPVLKALTDAGVFGRRPTRSWLRLTGQ